MKVQFQKPDRRQETLSSTQEEMRRQAPKRLRILSVLFGLIMLGVFFYAGHYLWTRQKIYTYGVVSGYKQDVSAPIRARVIQMNVRRGDFVRKGQVLAILTPDEEDLAVYNAIERLRRSRETLKSLIRQREELNELKNGGQPVSMNPADEDLERRLKNTRSDVTLKRVARKHEIAQATAELERKAERSKRQQQQINDVERHIELGTAIRADLARAQDLADTTKFEHDLAQRRLDFLTQSNQLASQEEDAEIALLTDQRNAARERIERMRNFMLAQNRQELSGLTRQIELMKEEVNAAEEGLNRTRERFASREINALFDGIVAEAPIPEGAVINAGQSILYIIAVDDIWIDAYVPPKKIALLESAKDIKIYTKQTSQPQRATLAERKGAIVPPPLLLQNLLPGINNAKYIRLTVDKADLLTPGDIVRVVIH